VGKGQNFLREPFPEFVNRLHSTLAGKKAWKENKMRTNYSDTCEFHNSSHYWITCTFKIKKRRQPQLTPHKGSRHTAHPGLRAGTHRHANFSFANTSFMLGTLDEIAVPENIRGGKQ